ncbi:hypothetical protein ABZY45_17640 [Streptomyces sp. NPDC006516]|uniref:hypothetical protein n=1 Tax=Streptomyces sp. NPDC006516 TaxID=3154309 RepID=UPI0033BF663D
MNEHVPGGTHQAPPGAYRRPVLRDAWATLVPDMNGAVAGGLAVLGDVHELPLLLALTILLAAVAVAVTGLLGRGDTPWTRPRVTL